MRNTRFITAIIAFAGTFAVSVGLVWLLFGFPVKEVVNYSHHNCSQRHADAIYSHLQRDIGNGRERDEKSFRANNREENDESGYSVLFHASSVAEYADQSGSLDTSNLPQDFQIAWHKHMDAWRNYSEFLTDMKEVADDGKISQKNFEILQNRYTNEVDRTWYEVLRISRNYGAFVE